MRPRDAEKITMNLTFLEENTVNMGVLLQKLIECELLSQSDHKRISSHVPDYNRPSEMYVSVILSNTSESFEKLLECLRSSGNDVVYDRLNPTVNYAEINAAFRKHWPFTLIFILANVGGVLYWAYRAHQYLFGRCY